ncbi:MAG: hypothetical protein ACYCX4_00555 [Bacillota bacterium]
MNTAKEILGGNTDIGRLLRAVQAQLCGDHIDKECIGCTQHSMFAGGLDLHLCGGDIISPDTVDICRGKTRGDVDGMCTGCVGAINCFAVNKLRSESLALGLKIAVSECQRYA